jgi:putative transposase
MVHSFPKIVKPILKRFSVNDYPVLNSRLFFEIWLTFILDKSLQPIQALRDTVCRI